MYFRSNFYITTTQGGHFYAFTYLVIVGSTELTYIWVYFKVGTCLCLDLLCLFISCLYVIRAIFHLIVCFRLPEPVLLMSIAFSPKFGQLCVSQAPFQEGNTSQIPYVSLCLRIHQKAYLLCIGSAGCNI